MSYTREKFYPDYVGRCWGPCPGTSEADEPERPYQVRWFCMAKPGAPGVGILQSADLGLSVPWIPKVDESDPQSSLVSASWFRYCKIAIDYNGFEVITNWENKGGVDTITAFWKPNAGSESSLSWVGQSPLPFYNGLLQSDGTKEVIVLYLKTGVDASRIYMRRQGDSFANESVIGDLGYDLSRLLEVDTGSGPGTRTTFNLWAWDESGQIVELESDGYTGVQSSGPYWYSPDCGNHEDLIGLTTTFGEIGYDGFDDRLTFSVTFASIVSTLGVIDSGGPHGDVSTVTTTLDDITHTLTIVSAPSSGDESELEATLDDVTYTQAVFDSGGPHVDETALTVTFDDVTYQEVAQDSGGPHVDETNLTATFDSITYATP